MQFILQFKAGGGTRFILAARASNIGPKGSYAA